MLLPEYIQMQVALVITEAKTGFNYNKFKSMKSYEAQLEYANANLDYVGEGSSRIVFQLNSRLVLKMSNLLDINDDEHFENREDYNLYGQMQNEKEVEIFTDPNTKAAITKIYDFDEDFLWILSQYAAPINDATFKNITGVSMDEVEEVMEMLSDNDGIFEALENSINEDVGFYENKLKALSANGEPKNKFKYEEVKKILLGLRRFRIIMDSDVVQQINNLSQDHGLVWEDLMVTDQWGKTPDGNVVVVDYGWEGWGN